MKKTVLILLIVFVVVIVSSCKAQREQELVDYGAQNSLDISNLVQERKEIYQIAEEINHNSNLGEYTLTRIIPESYRGTIDTNFMEPTVISDATPDANHLDGYFVFFDDDYRQMALTIHTEKYTIFKIKVGDSVESVETKLVEYGYTQSESQLNDTIYTYYNYEKNGLCTIEFKTLNGSDMIYSIYIVLANPDANDVDGAY